MRGGGKRERTGLGISANEEGEGVGKQLIQKNQKIVIILDRVDPNSPEASL